MRPSRFVVVRLQHGGELRASLDVELSFPCFIDPSWDAVCPVLPLDGAPPADEPQRRWDGSSVRAWEGTYGDYLTAKVSQVFPPLFERVSRPADAR